MCDCGCENALWESSENKESRYEKWAVLRGCEYMGKLPSRACTSLVFMLRGNLISLKPSCELMVGHIHIYR